MRKKAHISLENIDLIFNVASLDAQIKVLHIIIVVICREEKNVNKNL
jgi:hypothetical protein